MADIKFNFTSQWPTLQVARVIKDPQSSGEEDPQTAGARRHYHGLGFPPLAIGMSGPRTLSWADAMIGLDVDENYVYMPIETPSRDNLECAVVYAIDISKQFSYTDYSSALADPLEDTSGGTLDLRKFLLHSRAVGPMVMDVVARDFTSTGEEIVYNSPLDYPTFSFGYVHTTPSSGYFRKNRWLNAPLGAQAYPGLFSDGFRSMVNCESISNQDKGSIIAMRNPAIISHNTVNVTV